LVARLISRAIRIGISVSPKAIAAAMMQTARFEISGAVDSVLNRKTMPKKITV
jgi:hypothetical protein